MVVRPVNLLVLLQIRDLIKVEKNSKERGLMMKKKVC